MIYYTSFTLIHSIKFLKNIESARTDASVPQMLSYFLTFRVYRDDFCLKSKFWVGNNRRMRRSALQNMNGYCSIRMRSTPIPQENWTWKSACEVPLVRLDLREL